MFFEIDHGEQGDDRADHDDHRITVSPPILRHGKIHPYQPTSRVSGMKITVMTVKSFMTLF